MSNADCRKSFERALVELRSGNAAAAIPFLEDATRDPQLAYAPSVLKYARALVNNQRVAEVKYLDKSFKFALSRANFGLSIHHADGRFFEARELTYTSQMVPQRATIVDVGANSGNHVIFYLGVMRPSLVIPVEPVPASVDALQENLRLNNFTVDTRGLGVAAAEHSGWIAVQVGDRDLVEARTISDHEAPGATRVRATPLDDLIPERVDFLKVDVEGFELPVLRGARRILSEDKPLIMIEANHHQREQILQHLGQFNYKLFGQVEGVGYHNLFLRVFST